MKITAEQQISAIRRLLTDAREAGTIDDAHDDAVEAAIHTIQWLHANRESVVIAAKIAKTPSVQNLLQSASDAFGGYTIAEVRNLSSLGIQGLETQDLETRE